MVLVIGLPVFFAELFVGQYGGLGPIKAYERLAPLFHGITGRKAHTFNIV